MYRIRHVLGWAALLVAAVLLSGCKSKNKGDGGSGFKSPHDALNAYAKALEQGDEAAFRKVATKYGSAVLGLDAIVAMESDKDPAEAAKENLKALADIQGFGKVLSKRFAPEIDGDSAVIVQVFEDIGIAAVDDKFRKWKFEKSGDQWYLVDSDFGDAKDLPARYAWDKNIADVSDEMRDFVSGFDGTSEKVEAALKKHAEGVETDMDSYGLENPIVIAKSEMGGQVCYTLQVKSGAIKRKYEICWRDGKITSIKENM